MASTSYTAARRASFSSRVEVGGTEADAACAAAILNAWSTTLTTVTGNADRFLAAGLYVWPFANACELMRDYDGFDLAAAQEMLANVFPPLNNSFPTNHHDTCITNYWANWDLCTMASVLAIGILNEDGAKYDQAVYFKSGAGNGSIEHAVPYLYTDSDGYALDLLLGLKPEDSGLLDRRLCRYAARFPVENPWLPVSSRCAGIAPGLTGALQADTASPAAVFTLSAALWSRSWTVPQALQVHSRTCRGLGPSTAPQVEQIWEVGSNRPICRQLRHSLISPWLQRHLSRLSHPQPGETNDPGLLESRIPQQSPEGRCTANESR